MPTCHKRWVQCVSGGDWRGREGGEGRGCLGKLLSGGRDGGEAGDLPPQQHPPLLLAELVLVLLVLYPLQPKPGEVLKHDVIVRGVA